MLVERLTVKPASAQRIVRCMSPNYTAGMMRANMFLSYDGVSAITKLCRICDKVLYGITCLLLPISCHEASNGIGVGSYN
jgi:hypothetical protein